MFQFLFLNLDYILYVSICLSQQVHESASGRNFKSKLQAKHLDIMQSPWLIELIAFYMNLNGSDSLTSDELFGQLSYDLNIHNEESILLTLTLVGSEKLEYSLTCPICLVCLKNKHLI